MRIFVPYLCQPSLTKPELRPDSFGEPVVPLISIKILSDRGEVGNHNGKTVFPKTRCRPHHKRRLAHLARGQDIGKISIPQRLIKCLIGFTDEIALSI